MTNAQWKKISMVLFALLLILIGGLSCVLVDRSAREEEAKEAARREEAVLKVRTDYAEAYRLIAIIQAKDIEISAHNAQEHMLYDGKDRYKETKAYIEKSGRLFRERQALAGQYNAITFDTYGCTFENKSGLPATAEETLPCFL